MDASAALVTCCIVSVLFNVEAAPLLNCKYDEYVGGTRENPVCKKCLNCGIGFGLNQWCNNRLQFPIVNMQCIPCRNGTFSAYNSPYECDECRPECHFNEVEVRQCSPSQNRLCECRKGIFQSGVDGQCNQECCHCSHGSRAVVDKCQKDNLDDGRFCEPPGTSGKCPSLHSKVPAVNTSRKTWSFTKRMPSAQPSTKTISTASSAEVITTTNNTIELIYIVVEENGVDYWIILYVCLTVVLFTLVSLGYQRRSRQKKNVQQSGTDEADDIWLEEVLYKSVIYASDTMPLQKSNAAAPVRTKKRPTSPYLLPKNI